MFPGLHGFLPEPKDMLLSLIGGSELPVAAGIDSTTQNFNRKLIDVWKNCRSEDDLEFHLFISLPYYLLILCKSWTWLRYNEIPSEKGFWGIENVSFFHVCCFCFVILISVLVCSVWNYQTAGSLLAGRLQNCLDLETFRTEVPVQWPQNASFSLFVQSLSDLSVCARMS